jgi:hypothetical protein
MSDQPSTAPDWLSLATKAVHEMPTIYDGLVHLFTIMHNEMVAGGGMTNPQAVTQALLDHAAEVCAALEANVVPKAKKSAPVGKDSDGASA